MIEILIGLVAAIAGLFGLWRREVGKREDEARKNLALEVEREYRNAIDNSVREIRSERDATVELAVAKARAADRRDHFESQ